MVSSRSFMGSGVGDASHPKDVEIATSGAIDRA
jgi:hypothetical protein